MNKACLFLLLGLSAATHAGEDIDPPEIALGERLFLETRFAQAHAARPGAADPVMATTATTDSPLPGPFAGQTMNCRACHMVDEHADAHGMRSYADFARRPPIPARNDGKRLAERNSQALVASAIAPEGKLLLHYDGEFASLQDLVSATLTGRNYGWLPDEHTQAIHHIARVIREDDGKGALAREFGGSYRQVFAAADAVPPALRLPVSFRLDVDQASDGEIVAAVARLIGGYVADLDFSRDAQGRHDGSPYDVFLAANGIDRAPAADEDATPYSHRLLDELQALRQPVFIDGTSHRFTTHDRAFVFGAQELAGLKAFLDPRRGNCAACHVPPEFTDTRLHNTGASELDYERVHGHGSFARLAVPAAADRGAADLPPSTRHPEASGRFRAIPSSQDKGQADLGAWNTVLNPDLPHSQAALRAKLCPAGGCDDDTLLNRAFAAFKTPGLRDLGHSAPYLHDGSRDDLAAVIAFYREVSERARTGGLRHPAPELAGVNIAPQDIAPLVAFLRALDEDYD